MNAELTLGITTIGDLLLKNRITRLDDGYSLDNVSLKIPDYQRPYKWTAKNTNQLLDDIELLASQPYMGMECQEYLLKPDHYRRIISGAYLCFYRVIGNTVVIYHIVDGRTNYIRLFK